MSYLKKQTDNLKIGRRVACLEMSSPWWAKTQWHQSRLRIETGTVLEPGQIICRETNKMSLKHWISMTNLPWIHRVHKHRQKMYDFESTILDTVHEYVFDTYCGVSKILSYGSYILLFVDGKGNIPCFPHTTNPCNCWRRKRLSFNNTTETRRQ